jgi:hypothetical protein
MSRYLTSLTTIGLSSTPKVYELADLDEVRQEAATSARELISENVLRGGAPNGGRFVVTDETGTAVAEIPFKDTIEE